jgi:serine/threonine-protein phosphatase Stp1
MEFVSASQTHVGLRRKLNEDRVLERPECGLWAVADGMGGHEAGEVASAAIVDALAALPATKSPSELVAAAQRALVEVNVSLRTLAKADIRPKIIGSTVVGLVIAADEYRCFWAGDSRAFRVRGAEIEQLTRDHSLVQGLVDAGLVAIEDAESHPDSNVVTRAVGAATELSIDCVSGDARRGDIFVLASDGLTRVVNPHELLHEIRRKNPAQAISSLVELVLSRGAPDNVTIAVCLIA